MRTRFVLLAAFILAASHVFAQAPARSPQTPATPRTAPAAPAAPPAPQAPPTAAAPPPPPPAPPGPPRREGQPINVKVELTITEDGGAEPPIKKSITAVIGDGFNGYVREQGLMPAVPPNGFGRPMPLNLDAYPFILSNGKIRLSCTIQYTSASAAKAGAPDPRAGTDIKQSLILILESGKSLLVSQATDPISERRVTVEVNATILK